MESMSKVPGQFADDFNHTGHELELMLSGDKPLSMFYYAPEHESLGDEMGEFDRLVKTGRFVKAVRDFEPISDDPVFRHHYRATYLLYALCPDAWRIPAMFLTIEAMIDKGRTNEGIDRVKGYLLGYTKAQVDWYVSKVNYREK